MKYVPSLADTVLGSPVVNWSDQELSVPLVPNSVS